MIDFCFSLMSFGDRYYKQSERFISDRDNHCPEIKIIVITDNINFFKKFDNVVAIDVSDYDSKYLTYETNYYKFDNSCRRFLIPASLELGFKKIVFIDNDNHFMSSWDTNSFNELFKMNVISSPIVYDYYTHGKLGDKIIFYSKKFNHEINPNEIKNLPEGCINLLCFDTIERGENFFKTWDDCIKLRDENQKFTNNNLEEIYFSGKVNGMSFENAKTHPYFIAKHNIWYR